MSAELNLERQAFETYCREQAWMSTTLKGYRYIFGRLADWLQTNNLCLADVGVAEMGDFLDDVNWGNALRNKLSSMLRPFVRWKYGASHPLAKWKVLRVKAPPQRYLTVDQLSILFASFQPGIGSGKNNYMRRFYSCDTSHPRGIRNHAIISLMVDSGLRAAEICRLQISRLDLDKGTLTVRVKGGQYGYGFFSERTASLLLDWLEVRRQFATEESRDFVFIGLNSYHLGARLQLEGLKRMCRNLGLIAGIGPMSPHDIRRTFAILTPKLGGADTYEMMRAGNWSNPGTFMAYRRHEVDLDIRHKLLRNFV